MFSLYARHGKKTKERRCMTFVERVDNLCLAVLSLLYSFSAFSLFSGPLYSSHSNSILYVRCVFGILCAISTFKCLQCSSIASHATFEGHVITDFHQTTIFSYRYSLGKKSYGLDV